MAKKKAAPAIEFKPNCSTACRQAGRCIWRRSGECIAVAGKGPKPTHAPVMSAAKHAAEERKTRKTQRSRSDF